jgi:Uri superfamily endonuclease
MERNSAGTYVLALRLDAAQRISVGRLGEFRFPAGWYLYVGSAFGPGGLRARLARHRRTLGSRKRAHWHVDYLRERAVWGSAWASTDARRSECDWAAAVRILPGAEMVVRGFGASDCPCPTHLVRVPSLPKESWYATMLGARRIAMEDRALDDLLRVLASGQEEAREAAALAIGRFGSAAVEPLSAMLARNDADARWWAARALAEVGGNGAVQPLVGAMTDPDPDVRACAALALGRVGDGMAAPALAARLTDDSAFVAGIAADGLTMIGEPAIGVLAEVLADEDSHVRLLAVRSLGRMRTQSAIGPLFGALEDPSYLVRYYAREALDALGVGMVFFTP